MTTRSKQLYCDRPAVGTVTLYTCPSGTTTLIKGWQVTNGAGAATVAALSVVPAALGYGILLHPLSTALGSFAQLTSDHWIVLEPGDALQVVSTVAGLQVIVSGTELLGVAP